MAISFMNIRSNERREISDPHQIAAFINSSDLHVNSNLGQDFGWRLAPSLVHRIDQMRSDTQALDDISRRTGIAMEDLTTVHLVNEISRQDSLAERSAQVQGNSEPEFKALYEAELNAMREKEAAKRAPKKTAKKVTKVEVAPEDDSVEETPAPKTAKK